MLELDYVGFQINARGRMRSILDYVGLTWWDALGACFITVGLLGLAHSESALLLSLTQYLSKY